MLGKTSINVFIVLVVALLSAGCSHKYKVDSIATPEELIPRNSHYYVMIPEDGRFGHINYEGSSIMVVDAISEVLLARSDKVTTGKVGETLEQALSKAASGNIDYVFRPLILHWEDRATEWSGRPDRITINYTIFDVRTGSKIASTQARASSKWGTFGGDHPQDLVPKTVENFIDSVSR